MFGYSSRGWVFVLVVKIFIKKKKKSGGGGGGGGGGERKKERKKRLYRVFHFCFNFVQNVFVLFVCTLCK